MMYYFALLASDCFLCFGIIEERLEDNSQFQSSSLYKRKHRLRIYKTNESYMLLIHVSNLSSSVEKATDGPMALQS